MLLILRCSMSLAWYIYVRYSDNPLMLSIQKTEYLFDSVYERARKAITRLNVDEISIGNERRTLLRTFSNARLMLVRLRYSFQAFCLGLPLITENSIIKIDNIPRKASRMFEKFYTMLYMFIKFLKRFKKHLCNKIILQFI